MPSNYISRVSTDFLRFGASIWLTTLAGVALISGCSYNAPLDREAVSRGFPFLRPSQTQRAEIKTRLGTPIASYESDRILIYSVIESSSPGPFELGYARGHMTPLYHLVLVFGSDGALERHSLVRVQ